jgi:precorrin-6B C5,15-methyltransferase / cobalt-precorrin-6B C5,C15-methyltransferase
MNQRAADLRNPRWLTVVGIGEDGLDGLAPSARVLVDNAEILIGGDRHLAMLPEDGRERLSWPSPLRLLLDRIESMRGRRVCVLATGDPMCFGIGSTLVKRIALEEMLIVPAASALALAAARMGWPEHEIDLLTLHGRPLALLESYLQPRARLIILSHGATTPGEVAARLTERDYGQSKMSVLEHMGGPAERRIDGMAADWRHPPGEALNTIAVELVAGPDTMIRPRLPGLPDEAFVNDGQLTKREIRASTLAALAPTLHALLWDVGAGCGSVAIEWMRADRRCSAFAIEPRAERRAMIAKNAAALGVPGLKVVDGAAPDALAGLEAPDAIFIGGGASADGVIETCWSALKPGGRLVANVVTLEGEAAILAHQARLGGTLTRIAISRAEPVGPFQGWRPLMPVTQWCVAKPQEPAIESWNGKS